MPPLNLTCVRTLRLMALAVVCGLMLLPVAERTAAQNDALQAEDISIETRQDIYGFEHLVATGHLRNDGDEAYRNITLQASALDAGGEVVGGGIGYLVNACGAGVLPDFALQPDHVQPFEIILELDDPEARIDRLDISAGGEPEAPTPLDIDPIPGIRQIADAEVIAVEWLEPLALRYGVGCPRDLFTTLDWYHYSLRTHTALPTLHPRARDVTDTLIQRMNVAEPGRIDDSMLTFAPNSTRLLYQGEANRFYTAAANGTFQRVIYDDLYNRTLQGILWLGGDRFLAYYFGAAGDPVYYFTATAAGQPVSLAPPNLPLSRIVPGASPDGRRAVIAGTFDGETGYFLTSLVNTSQPQLLFEAEPAGNNWPAPLFLSGQGTDGAPGREVIYLARPVDGEARLQCFNLREGGPTDLTALPLDLSFEDRAWWWLSPDGQTIALAANGAHSGLWLIDLTALDDC